MTEATRKRTRKPAPKKPAAQKPAAPTGPTTEQVGINPPLDKEAFKMILSIIDAADIKGGDAGNIILLKQELARVAGIQNKPAA